MSQMLRLTKFNASLREEVAYGWTLTGDDAATGWIWTTQSYDWKGRPTLTTNPDGTTTENSYGGCGCAGGEVTTARDERGRRRRASQDVLGRLVKVEELNWDQSVYSTTSYTYNGRDQLTNINHAGQARSFEYDGHGRVSARVTPEQGRTTYSYYADDTMQTMTDARGATTTFGYNNRHQVSSITYGVPGGVSATPNVNIYYDSAGNRSVIVDGLGYADYQYNAMSQLISERRYFNDLGVAYMTHYGYNLAGDLSSMTTPWNEVVNYSHDRIGRVTGVTGNNGTVSYASGLQYRAFGALKQMTHGNGRALSVGYDARMRIKSWDTAGVMGWEYRYDTPNIHENTTRVAYARNLYDGTLDRSYDYDQVGRMWASHSGQEARGHTGLGAWGPADGPYAQNQSYDAYGNMVQRNGWGTPNSAYASTTFVNNRLQTNPVTGAAMQYDASGNLTADGQENFSYDATGQQSYASGSNLYQYYDGDGLRAKKVEAGVATYYVRSSMLGNQVQAEISGGWKRAYVYLGPQVLVMQEGGQTRWVHQDPVTKSQRVTNTAGTVVSTVDLDPWGGETWKSSNQGLMSRRYTSYERDTNGGDEAQMRRYQSRWTRFSQPDPYDGSYNLSDPQSFNRYSYTQNDPVNYTDPSGLLPGFCNAEYSFSDCGGWGGIYGGYYGDGYAAYRREFEGIPQEARGSYAQYRLQREVDNFFNSLPPDAVYGGGLSWVSPNYIEIRDGVWQQREYTFGMSLGLDAYFNYFAGGFVIGSVLTDFQGQHHPYTPPDRTALAGGGGAGGSWDEDIRLYRFGGGNESLQKLRGDAEKAERNIGIYGVSTTSITPKYPAPSALMSEVMRFFAVKKTGGPGHYTVVFPKPLNQQNADIFNNLFRNKHP